LRNTVEEGGTVVESGQQWDIERFRPRSIDDLHAFG
jgi:hypothetical protein